MSNNDSQQIVNKAWNFAHVLRDDGLRQRIQKQAIKMKFGPASPEGRTGHRTPDTGHRAAGTTTSLPGVAVTPG